MLMLALPIFCFYAAIDNSAAEDTSAKRLRRKRKPSEKVLELQAEKVKKPPQKKTSGKRRN